MSLRYCPGALGSVLGPGIIRAHLFLSRPSKILKYTLKKLILHLISFGDLHPEIQPFKKREVKTKLVHFSPF